MAKVVNAPLLTSGLRKRQTYEEVIDYIENDQDKLQYPDRTAKLLRNTFELSQLDGVGMHIMEQQQLRELIEREKLHYLRQMANNSDSFKLLKAKHDNDIEKPRGGPPAVHDMTINDGDGEYLTPRASVSSEIQSAPHEHLMPQQQASSSAAAAGSTDEQPPNIEAFVQQGGELQPSSSSSTTTRSKRVSSRAGTRVETNDPETGIPGGAAKESKPRGRPKKEPKS